MNARALALLLLLAVLASAAPVRGQLTAANDGPVVYGHHHINVSDVETHKRFWIGALGGRAVRLGTSTTDIASFPNVLVFLSERAPTGGTKGTTVNHVGFEVRNLRAAVDRVKAAGFPVVTGGEVPSGVRVIDDLAISVSDRKTLIAFVMGPDDTKVELSENAALGSDIAMHHVHFATPDLAAMKGWYTKVLDARPGMRGTFEAADLPGVNLTFSLAPDPVVTTRGRVLDHIGFEVRNLEAFTRRLEASGITLDRPYTTVPALGIAFAFLTDPWGTSIELTEGLAGVR